MNTAEKWHGTTILLLRKDGETVVAGDGQVSLGNTVLKSKAKKVRKIESRGVIAGFAGSKSSAVAKTVATANPPGTKPTQALAASKSCFVIPA